MNINELLGMFNTQNTTPTKLDEKMVEYGNVYKYPILKNNICEISILQIAPHSKIREHSHTDDSELYFFITDKKYSICKQGGTHELDNSSDEWMQVLSIKTNFQS